MGSQYYTRHFVKMKSPYSLQALQDRDSDIELDHKTYILKSDQVITVLKIVVNLYNIYTFYNMLALLS